MNLSNPLDPLKKTRLIRNNFTYNGYNPHNPEGKLVVGELMSKEEFNNRFVKNKWRNSFGILGLADMINTKKYLEENLKFKIK